jgi:hypothetical protein
MVFVGTIAGDGPLKKWEMLGNVGKCWEMLGNVWYNTTNPDIYPAV